MGIGIEVNCQILAILNSHLLNLILTKDLKTDMLRVLTLLMLKYVALLHPRLSRSLACSLLTRQDCYNVARNYNFHKSLFLTLKIRTI